MQALTADSLILASASPRRREILAELGIAFEVVVAAVVEHEHPATDPLHMVSHNAALKADWVSQRYPNQWILGADTTVHVSGQALNKPRDLEDARRMLRLLSGRTHQVHTGLALRHGSKAVQHNLVVGSSVCFRELTEAAITEYLRRVPVLDKAGSYAIQECREIIISSYTGSYTNIVGLPQEETKQLLLQVGLL